MPAVRYLFTDTWPYLPTTTATITSIQGHYFLFDNNATILANGSFSMLLECEGRGGVLFQMIFIMWRI